MEVDHAVDRVVLVLHANPIAQGADQTPHMRVAGGLHTRENSLPVNHPSDPRSRHGVFAPAATLAKHSLVIEVGLLSLDETPRVAEHRPGDTGTIESGRGQSRTGEVGP